MRHNGVHVYTCKIGVVGMYRTVYNTMKSTKVQTLGGDVHARVQS